MVAIPLPTQLDEELISFASSLEIDSCYENSRKAPYSRYILYRIWNDIQLVGTFYRKDQNWVAKLEATGKTKRCKSAQLAQRWLWQNRPKPVTTPEPETLAF